MQDALSTERLLLALTTLLPLFGTLLARLTDSSVSTLVLRGRSVLFRVRVSFAGAAAAGSLLPQLREVAPPKSVVAVS
jgi:hypothetical protein